MKRRWRRYVVTRSRNRHRVTIWLVTSTLRLPAPLDGPEPTPSRLAAKDVVRMSANTSAVTSRALAAQLERRPVARWRAGTRTTSDKCRSLPSKPNSPHSLHNNLERHQQHLHNALWTSSTASDHSSRQQTGPKIPSRHLEASFTATDSTIQTDLAATSPPLTPHNNLTRMANKHNCLSDKPRLPSHSKRR